MISIINSPKIRNEKITFITAKKLKTFTIYNQVKQKKLI
ncbi:hypothetical Protein psc1_06490 [Candidatus Phytoplasma solani]